MNTAQNQRFLDRTSPPHIVTLVLLAGIGALNMSIFLPSLARMTDYFDTTYAVMQLAVSAYLAMTAVTQLIVGPISDKIGRRNVVLWALALFLIATLGAMLAPTVEVFLGFRMLQAAAAIGMVTSRTIVRDMFPEAKAASMIGYVTMGMALVPMFGPTLGGTLQQLFDWQSIFVVLLAAGAIVWTLCYYDLGETLQEGGMGFREQISNYPALFASPRFWGYSLATAFSAGGFFALLGGSSFVATSIFGLSPFWAGVGLGAPAVGYTLGNFLSGRFSQSVGINKMALYGTLAGLFGMTLSLVLTLLGLSSPWIFFGFCTFLGLGNGLTIPNASSGLLSVRPKLAGTASGLGGALMVGGGAALSQIAGSVLSVESGVLPLKVLMFVVSILAMLSILFVIWREKQINA